MTMSASVTVRPGDWYSSPTCRFSKQRPELVFTACKDSTPRASSHRPAGRTEAVVKSYVPQRDLLQHTLHGGSLWKLVASSSSEGRRWSPRVRPPPSSAQLCVHGVRS